ncbi:MAG TPA: hypothetical protein DEF42_16495 [Desulfosporosinus sp.]|nr:hypothetical protein [Desulfosporosinus sp.]
MRCDKLKPRLMTTIALAFILFFSQIITFPQEAMAAQPSVVLSGVKGEVLVKKGGGLRELSAVNGMELVQGDWLRTGKNGTAKLSYGDGTEATIGSNSSLTIQRLTRSDFAEVSSQAKARVTFSQSGQQSSLQLWSGSVWNKVKSLLNMDDSYEVETPTAVMGVRGTLYLVSVNPENGATQGDVVEGVVGVTQNNEATQSAPIQLVTMGQTLRLVSLDEPMPEHQVIDPQELIRSAQAEILVQLVNDIMERAKDLTVLTQEQQSAYKQTGVVDHLKAAIGTSFKVDELAKFSKEFVTSLKTSDKLEEVKQVLKDNDQSFELLQSTINTLKNETEEIRSEIVETAKESGVSEEEIESLEKEAVGIPPTPDSITQSPITTTPTPPTPPTTGSNNGSSSSGSTTVISNEYTVSLGTISNVPYRTDSTTFLSNILKGESHQTWDVSGVHNPVRNGDRLVVIAQNGTQMVYTISIIPSELGMPVPVSQGTPITFKNGVSLDLGSLSILPNVTVTAEEVDSASLPEGTIIGGKVINFTFSGMTVNNSVTLTLPIDPDADPEKVGIYYLNGSVWEYQDSIVQDGKVVATVNHFSTYGVLQDTVPPTLTSVTEGAVTIGDMVEAASTEEGFIYLVPSATSQALDDLNLAVTETKGTKAAVNANTPVSLITTGLASGTYKIYAIDRAGNISSGWAVTLNASDVGTGIITGVAKFPDSVVLVDYSGIKIIAKGFTTEGIAIEFVTTTSSDGTFSLTQLPKGNYILEASKTGYYSTSKVAEGINDQTTVLEEVMILYPEVVSGTVKGYAKFIDQQDYQGIVVKIQTLEGRLLPDLIAMTDSQGYFEFTDVPVDNITDKSTYIFTAYALDGAMGYATDSVEVTVNANQITTISETLWLRPAAEEVIIFADDPSPWGSEALQDMLEELGVSYNIYSSESMSEIPLPINKTVWIINDQPQDFYNAYKANQSRFDDFVKQGGTLLFEACDQGGGGGSIVGAGATLPGGVVNEIYYDEYNTNVNTSHPMMAGVPANLQGNYASHNYFINLPDISTVLCADSLGNPTLVEYKYEQGRVVATGQPLEFYWGSNNNLRQIYPNMIYYTFHKPVSSGLTDPFFVISNDNGTITVEPIKSQNTLTYTAVVENDVDWLTLTPTAAEGKITVNGLGVNSGTVSDPIYLNVGGNTIYVVVSEVAKMPKAYTITVTREGSDLEAPRDINTFTGNGFVVLDWNPVIDATNYKVFQSTDLDGEYTEVYPGISKTDTHWVVTGLTNDTTYYFMVKASNVMGDSMYSDIVSAKPQMVVPGTVVGLQAAAEDGQVNLSWQGELGAEFYRVYQSITSGGPYTEVDPSIKKIDTSFAVGDLSNGTTYYFVVKASNEAGDGENSSEVSAQPIAIIDNTVADFACIMKSDTTATFTWSPVVGATGIKIEKALTGTSEWNNATGETIEVGATTALVTGLTASTGYDFRLVVTGGLNAGTSNVLVNVKTETPGV